MIKQLSFTRYEHKILPNFRQMIGKAESTEDVKKFFVYTAIELFEDIFEGKMDFEYLEKTEAKIKGRIGRSAAAKSLKLP